MTKLNEQDFMAPQAFALPTGATLVFAPHPDDEIFGCGGAIIRHIQQGDQVKVVIVTDGGLPVNESQKTSDYTEIRKNESLAAAKLLDYGKPLFLNFKDGFLKADDELITQLHQLIIEFNPQNIYLPSETEIHPDHLALNKAAVEVVKKIPKNINLFFYEIGQPLHPNFFLDITEQQPILDQAMDCFQSQLTVQEYKNQIRSLHAYRSYTLGKNVKFAEAYRRVASNELKTGEMLWQEKQKNNVPQPSEIKIKEDFPLISVIVRTMNRPQLPEALESIAAQTYPNLEVIVVDAQGENPLQLGHACGKFPLQLISKDMPLNRPEAANAGLGALQGEYFCFLDEDDLLAPEHVEQLFIKLSTVDYPAAYDIVEMVNNKFDHVRYFDESYNYNRLLIGNYIPLHALLFKSKFLLKGYRFDRSLTVYEDWDFLLQFAQSGDFLYVPNAGGIYRNLDASRVHDDKELVKQFRMIVLNKWKCKIDAEKYYHFINFIVDENFEKRNTKDLLMYELKERTEQLENELKICHAIIEDVKNSKSWKLTTPLRYFSKLHSNWVAFMFIFILLGL